MTDQATAETTAKQPCRPAPAKHDTLAVLAFIFGILLLVFPSFAVSEVPGWSG